MADMNLRGVVDLGALAAARKQEAASAAAKATAPSGVILDVVDATFDAEVVERSLTVPVILDFWSPRSTLSRQVSPILEKLAAEYGGRFVLAKVDADANPGLAQAFRLQSIPAVFALIAKQAVPLFQDPLPEPQVRVFLDKVLELAAEHGATGTVGGAAPAAPEEPQEDPRYLAIHQAILAGQFDVAEQAAQALVEARDPEGAALLAYVGLQRRIAGGSPDLARAAAAAAPASIPALLHVCDFDLLELGPQSVYERLLAALRAAAPDDRGLIRDRLLEYFAIVGPVPETTAARKAMTAALF